MHEVPAIYLTKSPQAIKITKRLFRFAGLRFALFGQLWRRENERRKTTLPKPGITPAESRRVSIGQELLTNPSNMFGDELTSGNETGKPN